MAGKKAKENPEDYGADNIQVLEGLEAVRKRPGMYIGSTGERGLHHLVYEIVDNSVDEALAGHCTLIDVTMLADGGLRVIDNGRGIPVDMHPTEKKSSVEVVLTILHAGGKFGGGGYAVSGGLHGVGSSVVNALSTRLDVAVKRQGNVYTQSYRDGVPVKPLEKGAATEETGTTITFWPRRSASLGAIRRDMMSMVLPGGNGTTIRIGFDGKACAHAPPTVNIAAASKRRAVDLPMTDSSPIGLTGILRAFARKRQCSNASLAQGQKKAPTSGALKLTLA
jgi:hypothetical protein